MSQQEMVFEAHQNELDDYTDLFELWVDDGTVEFSFGVGEERAGGLWPGGVTLSSERAAELGLALLRASGAKSPPPPPAPIKAKPMLRAFDQVEAWPILAILAAGVAMLFLAVVIELLWGV